MLFVALSIIAIINYLLPKGYCTARTVSKRVLKRIMMHLSLLQPESISGTVPNFDIEKIPCGVEEVSENIFKKFQIFFETSTLFKIQIKGSTLYDLLKMKNSCKTRYVIKIVTVAFVRTFYSHLSIN